MTTLLYNLDQAWDFQYLCLHHALDWYPHGTEGVEVWDLGQAGTGSHPVLPWPLRIAPEQAFSELGELASCRGNIGAVVVCLEKKQALAHAETFDLFNSPILKDCPQRILFLRCEELLVEQAQQALSPLVEAFHWVVVCEPTGAEPFSILRIVVETAHAFSPEKQGYPFSWDVAGSGSGKWLSFSLEGETTDRVSDAFHEAAVELRGRIRFWRNTSENGGWKNALDALQKGVLDLVDDTGTPEFSADEPTVALPEASLFFHQSLEAKITSAVEQFRNELFGYLNGWFSDLNDLHRQRKLEIAEDFFPKRDELAKLLSSVAGVEQRDLDSSLEEVRKQQAALKKEMDELVGDLQSDLTRESRQHFSLRGSNVGNFIPRYFQAEEKALETAVRDARFSARSLASLRHGIIVVMLVMALTVLPAGILWYWGPLFPLMSHDTLAMVLWLLTPPVVAAISLLIAAWKYKRVATNRLQQLKGRLQELLNRHRKTMRNTEKYLSLLLARRQLHELEELLRQSRDEHQYWRKWIGELENLLPAVSPHGGNIEPEHPGRWWNCVVDRIRDRVNTVDVEQRDNRRSGELMSLRSRFLSDRNHVVIDTVTLS